MRVRLRRIARSPFTADLRAHGWLIGLVLAGLLCLVLTRGQFVDWTGWHEIPGAGPR